MQKLDPRKTYGLDDFTLIDDGTLDTVIEMPNGEDWRYDMETASDYRDPDSGALNFEAFIRDVVIPDMDADPDIWDA